MQNGTDSQSRPGRRPILFSRQLHTWPDGSGIPADLYEQFRKARIEILTHIDRPWTTDSMAALTNLGVSQFYRGFCQYGVKNLWLTLDTGAFRNNGRNRFR